MVPPTNDFTEGQMAIIEQTAWRVGEVVASRLKDDFKIIVDLHAARCPQAEKLAALEASITQERAARKGFLRGVAALAAVVGGAFAFIVTKIVEHVFK